MSYYYRWRIFKFRFVVFVGSIFKGTFQAHMSHPLPSPKLPPPHPPKTPKMFNLKYAVRKSDGSACFSNFSCLRLLKPTPNFGHPLFGIRSLFLMDFELNFCGYTLVAS